MSYAQQCVSDSPSASSPAYDVARVFYFRHSEWSAVMEFAALSVGTFVWLTGCLHTLLEGTAMSSMCSKRDSKSRIVISLENQFLLLDSCLFMISNSSCLKPYFVV